MGTDNKTGGSEYVVGTDPVPTRHINGEVATTSKAPPRREWLNAHAKAGTLPEQYRKYLDNGED